MNIFLTPEFFAFLAIVYIWTLPWKAVAMWKAARHDDFWWFVAFLFVHTLGVLEILYIFVFSKTENKPSVDSKRNNLQRVPKRRAIAKKKVSNKKSA